MERAKADRELAEESRRAEVERRVDALGQVARVVGHGVERRLARRSARLLKARARDRACASHAAVASRAVAPMSAELGDVAASPVRLDDLVVQAGQAITGSLPARDRIGRVRDDGWILAAGHEVLSPLPAGLRR